MNQENNIIIPSFFFSIKEYLFIFNITSLLTLNDFINTHLTNISKITVLRIFLYGMFEYKNSLLNSPELTSNIISKVLLFLKKDKDHQKILSLILNSKNIEDLDLLKKYLE